MCSSLLVLSEELTPERLGSCHGHIILIDQLLHFLDDRLILVALTLTNLTILYIYLLAFARSWLEYLKKMRSPRQGWRSRNSKAAKSRNGDKGTQGGEGGPQKPHALWNAHKGRHGKFP